MWQSSRHALFELETEHKIGKSTHLIYLLYILCLSNSDALESVKSPSVVQSLCQIDLFEIMFQIIVILIYWPFTHTNMATISLCNSSATKVNF